MSWLRIDDGFVTHPKLVALGPPATRWAWLEVLSYCAAQRTAGVIPNGIGDVVKRATPTLLRRAQEVGLIDVDGNGSMRVHDWNRYNSSDFTNAERQARYRERQHAESNGPVTEKVTAENVTRTQARVRGPSPKSKNEAKPLSSCSASYVGESSLNPAATLALAGSRFAASTNATEDLEPDPEGLKRLATIMGQAAEEAHVDKEALSVAELASEQAEAKRRASLAWLEKHRADEDQP